ncbi:MAG: amidohydrolase family protein [Pirellulaceae bacterium]|nr:amidohydrolase family protein [Pirellulaceae bacterium]
MLDRRTFINRSSGAVLAGAVAVSLGETVSGAPQASDCIDAHVHVWTPDTQQYPLSGDFKVKDMVPPSFTPEELFAHCKPSGVSRIVLIQMSFYKYDNSYMLAVMKKYPGVFAGVAIVDESQADTPAKMKELRALGVLGFRLYTDKVKAEGWSGSAGMKSMWSTAADTGQSMCLLANPDALPAVEAMIKQYPRTRVVIDHFARIGVSGKVETADLDNLCRLAKFPNVYVKTSAFYALGAKKAPYTDLVPMIMRLVKEYGASRLMWASDCPYQVQEGHTYAASIDLVRNHLPELSAAERQAILRDTAAKVFFA